MISCGRTTDLSQTRLTGFCAPASPPPLGSATGPDSPRAKGAKSAGPESEQPVLALLRFGCAAVGTWLPRSGPQTVLVSGRDGIGQSPRLMGAGPKPLCFSGFGHCVPESGALAQPGPRRARPTPPLSGAAWVAASLGSPLHSPSPPTGFLSPWASFLCFCGQWWQTPL